MHTCTCMYMYSLVPRLHFPAFYRTVIKSWGVESGVHVQITTHAVVHVYVHVVHMLHATLYSSWSTHFLQSTARDFIFLPVASSTPSSPPTVTLAPSTPAPAPALAHSLSRSRAELAAAIRTFRLASGVRGVPVG